MSGADLGTDVARVRAEHSPIWAVAFAALLLAVSFGRYRVRDKTSRTEDRTPLEAGRGRSADTPSEIPAQGWKDILLRVYRGISEDRILLVAAGVTFYLLLSIFPGIAALFSIYGLFANPADIAGHLDALANVAPGGALDILRDEKTRLASKGGTTLGIGFLVSLAVSLWTTNSGVSAIFDALNIVHEEKETRGTLKFYITTLTFTLASIIFYSAGNCNSRAFAGGIELHPAAWRDGSAREDRAVANTICAHGVGVGGALQIWSEPHSATLALGHLGQRLCHSDVGRRFSSVLVVRDEFRQLR